MLNLNLKDIAAMSPVSVSEYQKITANLAKVIVVCATQDRAALATSLQASLKNRAAPILSSFRWLERGASMVGYVAPIRETVEVDSKILASYRLISSAQNLYMKPEEDGLWELRNGAGGQYLSKTAPDDLGELIESVRAGRMGAPRMAQVTLNASATQTSMANRLVAYISDDGIGRPFTEYGFCVGMKKDTGASIVCSPNATEVVANDRIVAHYEVDHNEIRSIVARANRVRANLTDKADVISYYKQLYGYDPEYLSKVIKTIEEQAAL